ncbi:hypothetical protein [Intrasporangium sp.]
MTRLFAAMVSTIASAIVLVPSAVTSGTVESRASSSDYGILSS